jgi:hypothetical protein
VKPFTGSYLDGMQIEYERELQRSTRDHHRQHVTVYLSPSGAIEEVCFNNIKDRVVGGNSQTLEVYKDYVIIYDPTLLALLRAEQGRKE